MLRKAKTKRNITELYYTLLVSTLTQCLGPIPGFAVSPGELWIHQTGLVGDFVEEYAKVSFV